MSFLNRLINIIKSNINYSNDINFDFNINDNSEFKYSNESEYENSDNRNMSDFEKKEREYYAILEVPYNSDLDTIKKSYRNLLKKYHPDLFHNEPAKYAKAQKLTEKINEAYNYFEKKYS